MLSLAVSSEKRWHDEIKKGGWGRGSVQTAKVLANVRTPLRAFAWFRSVEPSLSLFRGTSGFSGTFRVWSSSLRRLRHRPAAGRPAGSSGPGSRSPTGRESAGSSPPAPQRHTGRRLWSWRWPLHKESPDGRFKSWEDGIKIRTKTAK